jgi:Fe-S cluster biogenesis protein NfuA
MAEAYGLLSSQWARYIGTARTRGGRSMQDGMAGPIDETERERRKEALDDLVELMRPAVQADGGDIALVEVDYDSGVVEVQLQGACGSCAISAVTLQGGVERLLKERLPWVTEVKGGVDDSVDFFESAALGRGGYVPRWE